MKNKKSILIFAFKEEGVIVKTMLQARKIAFLLTPVFRLVVCLVLFFVPVFFVRAQERDSSRVKILYPVNQSLVLQNFAGNADALARLNHVLEVTPPGDIRIMVITSAASPEGPIERNLLLSRERGESLRQFILDRRPDLAPVIEVCSVGEAWDELRALDASVPQVNDERLLRAFPRFQLLLDEFMPGLRYARVDFAPRVYAISSWESEGYLPRFSYGLAGFPVVRPMAEQPAGFWPRIGISTNIPYDITYIPNYGITSVPSFSLEYYPRHGKYTMGADLEIPMWRHPAPEHRYMQIQNLTLWVRRYFKPVQNRFRGTYLLASANAARYGIGWNAKGWEGEGLGASLGGGYKFLLGKRLFLDLGGAIGFFYSAYDPFVWGNDATGRYYYDYAGDPTQFSRRRKRLFWAGPTRVFISLGIDLFDRKR